MTRRGWGLVLAAGLLATRVGAVGFGPLVKDGVIDGPRKGFMLDLLNPYDHPADFIVYAVGLDDELRQPRVSILPAETELGPGFQRKVLVVADDLQVGETYRFRVCAERKNDSQGVTINARVCSKLSARRVG